MRGIDTNILLYAHDRSSPLFEPAKQFIVNSCEDGLIGLAHLSLLEFYSVITDGRKISNPLQPFEATEIIDDILSADEFDVFYSNRSILNKTLSYAKNNNISRFGINNIYIAQTLSHYGIDKIYTLNTEGFKKINFIDAINPFEPIANRVIPYGRQSIDEKDVAAVCSVLRSDWLTQGPKVREFEKALEDYCGAKYCIAVCNGTAALHLACLALGIGQGDVGLTSPITFMASANCIAYCGGRPIFADIDPETLCLSTIEVEACCSKKSPPKVVIPVDFAGVPAELPKLKELSDKYGFILIEDAAHAIGSTYTYQNKEYACGSCAHTDLSIFSFHPVKTITTGEGGAVLTNNSDLAHKVRCLANHGIERDPSRFVQGDTDSSHLQTANSWYHEMQHLGYNYRITDIQCALGLSQLKRLDQFKERRKQIVRRYNEGFQPLAEKKMLELPPWPVNTDPCFHLYVLRVRNETKDFRGKVFTELQNQGIYPQVHYIPVYLQPYYQKHFEYKAKDFPYAESYYEKALSLPFYPTLQDDQINHVIDTISKALS